MLTEAPPKTRGFETIPADSHPLWRGIKAKLDRSKLRVLKEQADLNASRGNVLTSFLRFGQRECPADRYVLFFYGHGYGPLGLFFDAESDDASAKSTMPLTSLSDSLHAVGERAAVIVFRACLANTLETAYQLRDAGEFMLASQSIVPIAGIWPWGSFLTSLMPGAASGDVAQAIARQLALFLETPENRDPFADVPYSLIDLGAASAIADPLKALVDALETARTDAGRASACAAALEASRVGFPDDSSAPGDPALLDVPTMCDNLGKLSRDPVAGPARALGEVVERQLVKWHRSQKGHHRGIGLYYKPVTAEHVERSHPVRGRYGGGRRGTLQAIGPEPGHGLGSDRAQSARVMRGGRTRQALEDCPCVMPASVSSPPSSWSSSWTLRAGFAPLRFPPIPPGFAAMC